MADGSFVDSRITQSSSTLGLSLALHFFLCLSKYDFFKKRGTTKSTRMLAQFHMDIYVMLSDMDVFGLGCGISNICLLAFERVQAYDAIVVSSVNCELFLQSQ